VPIFLPVAVAPVRERPIELDHDELVRVGLTRLASGTERVVVVVEHAQAPRSEHNHRFDGLEGKPEHRPETGEIPRIVDVQQVGDLMLDEEPGRVDFVEVDEKYLLELP